MEAKQRKLLFKLAVCSGIGNLGMLKVLDFSMRYNNSTDFSKEEIIQIAGITTYQKNFSESWDHWTNNPEKLTKYYDAHTFITIVDPVYPYYLKQIYNCPVLLFYRGNLSLLEENCLAFIGARAASVYGINVARQLIPEMIGHNLTIVSGLAKGIDSISHQVAMQNGGNTIGVIGTGLDICYPKETAHIQRKMMEEQLVISEYPNGTGPNKYHFPMRNRIIAGMTLGTCVIEARKKSGTLITAQAALEYGREVFAVPGNLFDAQSDGCHALIQDGAKCTISAQDILEEIQFFSI
ncbi:DNA-processing protein DprA [Enterococcus caccae]|uniref:DNA protecting protein DprA n=1 Tax=Enterococcus caccae ATCC BAA-1240 TaxID=1158612 RepID=R3WAA2_9ENTE|nr:DNA-processing protein DprA [Enterococcus caccae]EOL44382.1 DNA protecting protein DprA [Enterococcus caccae ATCC BAA-1240]EOT68502.1 DNA protecting protein DprA [Enterococcus caccae ATCC BAA-1240]OJG28285.1 DNA protecting protein DprA [Enterococcus caccae]